MLTWDRIKAYLKPYFDTLYSVVSHVHAAATASVAGFMSTTDKSKLDASTSVNTASALVQRDANGDVWVRGLRGSPPILVSEVSGTSYTNAIQIREVGLGGAQGGVTNYAPRLAFHWGGLIASQIFLDSAGRFMFANGDQSVYADVTVGSLYSVRVIQADGGFSGSLSGNASTATTLAGDQSNWASYRANAVANMLSWKNYGSGHVLFDASNSTAPNGAAINNTNATNAWIATYPTIMGWNGSSSFGVRVERAQNADNALQYSEGDWTPYITFSGGSGCSYAGQLGRYRKMGRMVSLTGYIQLSNRGGYTGAADLYGFPFVVRGYTGAYSAVTFAYVSGITYWGFLTAYVVAADTRAHFHCTAEDGSQYDLTHLNFNNSAAMMISIMYEAA